METALLFIHLIAALGLVGLVLMQRSEGGALGLGGGGGGLMTGRGAADVLARATTVLAAVFFLTSLSLTLLAQATHKQKSVIETAPVAAPIKPLPAPAAPPVRAAPLETFAPPADGGLVAPAPEPTAERAAPLAPAAVAVAPKPAAGTASAPAPAAPAVKPAPKPVTTPKPTPPVESVQTPAPAPAQPQLRPRAGPDE